MSSSSLAQPGAVARQPSAPRAATHIATRVLQPQSLSQADISAWRALEDRAAEPNAYLSPHFVLPALKHLDPRLATRLLVAEQPTEHGPRLLGLALLHGAAPQRHLPLPHLVGYRSRHSYLGHWLLDREHAADAAEALLRLARRRHPWAAAVTLHDCPLDGPQATALQQAAQRLGQGPCVISQPQARAWLVPAHAGAAALRERLGAKQHANQERCRRRLQEQGRLSWTALRAQVTDSTIEHFLALEHGGWKREAGTSLRSHRDDEAFFTAMARGFAAEGRALFTELQLDGRPIASTANFVSGDMGFAFKVGWDEALRKYGVGLLNEAGFVEQAPVVCGDLRSIDSGAQPASFIEALWPEQRRLGTLHIPLNPLGRWVLAGVEQLRRRRAPKAAITTAEAAA